MAEYNLPETTPSGAGAAPAEQPSYDLMDGKLHVYKRPGSCRWQCSTYLGGRNLRESTKETNLALAKEFAIEWYMLQYAAHRQRRRAAMPLDGTVQLPTVGTDSPVEDRRRRTPSGTSFDGPESVQLSTVETNSPIKDRRRRIPSGPSFREAAEIFLVEYAAATQGERNPVYVADKGRHVKNHLLPFFGDKAIIEVTSDLIMAYRVHRISDGVDLRSGEKRRPARTTLHSEIVTLRQIMKMAERKRWIAGVPDMSETYRRSNKVAHRAWFSPDEYKRLYEATRERARNPKSERQRADCEDLHDYILIMGNTGLRPDEAARLEERDIDVEWDEDTAAYILAIKVRGKRGTGYCKSMPGAVHPYRRLRRRKNLKPTDSVFSFGKVQRGLFNSILKELELKYDREGNVRTAYSLRHTYICMRLTDKAPIYELSKNCRTSVEMIEKHYAVHIKDRIDTAAINVRKPKSKSRKASAAKKASERRKG